MIVIDRWRSLTGGQSDTKTQTTYTVMQWCRSYHKDFEYYNTSLDPRSEFLNFILNTPDDSDPGYYIFCDINYTSSCKDRTEQLALIPNKRKINDNELEKREREKGRAGTEKIMIDQNNKTEYMVHYRMLKFYVNFGVKVTKTHWVI